MPVKSSYTCHSPLSPRHSIVTTAPVPCGPEQQGFHLEHINPFPAAQPVPVTIISTVHALPPRCLSGFVKHFFLVEIFTFPYQSSILSAVWQEHIADNFSAVFFFAVQY